MSTGEIPTTPTFFDGVLLAVNALPDVALVIDCANCGEDKFAMVGHHNDLMSTLLPWDRKHRVRFSDLKADDMVMGTEDKLVDTVRRIVAEVHPSLVLLTQSSTVRLVGTDIDNLAAELEEELDPEVAVVHSSTLSGDFLGGFATTLEVLAERVSLDAGAAEADRIGIVGYLFERHEEDHWGNLRELQRLLDGLSLATSSVWLDGSRSGDLPAIARSTSILALPYGLAAATRLGERLGCDVDSTRLPLGLEGTTSWIRDVARARGREELGETLVAHELDRIAPRLEKVVRRTFMGRHVGIVADPHLAAGLLGYLRELGFEVPLVAVHSRRTADGAAIEEQLGPAEGAVVLDPTFGQLETSWQRLHDAGELDLIVGSSRARDTAKALGLPFLELGYPCYVRHCFYDAPFLGYAGAMWLADALFNLLNERDYRAR